jgi:all-trans-retinol 13,14-reductase
MGGMTAAALLAKLGDKVLVLEQHYVPGGFTHTFSRKGYTWDVGVHAVGEVTQHSMPGRMLRWLTDGRLKWNSLGPVYDEFYYPDGFRIDFPDTPEQYRANLVALFPDEAQAIDDYIGHARTVAASMKGYYLARALPKSISWIGEPLMARKAQRYLAQRTQDVVAGLTDNPKLRSLLVAQWGYYGSPPSRSSFAIQALVVKHFLHGGYYPEGGSDRIAVELLRTVAEAGGWTRIVADVEQVLVENGRAVGVRMQDGEEIRAPRVISAAGAMATTKRLLPPEYAKQPWATQIQALTPAAAHVCLYMGFKGDIREGGASPANKWFYNTWNPEDETWQVAPGQPLSDAPVLYCSFPSLKDPTHDPGPDCRHTGEVVTFVPWEVFEPWRGTKWRKRGPEYEAFKAAIQERLTEQFLRRMPKLRSMLDYAELSTPLSTDLFCRPMQGSIYGIEPTVERFKTQSLRPRTPIKGLFLAGSEVTSVGVIGAFMGGVLAVAAAEPREMFDIIRGT